MPTNLERKFRLTGRTTGDLNTRVIHHKNYIDFEKKTYWQTDTFYKQLKDEGSRLKLREEGSFNNRGELIRYKREDVKGERNSLFEIVKIEDVKVFKSMMDDVAQVKNVLKKHRWKYTLRGDITYHIHIDYIPDLGNFIEFEITHDPNSSEQKKLAAKMMEELVNFFDLEREEEIPCAYVDLLK